jgi:hypothetical protein
MSNIGTKYQREMSTPFLLTNFCGQQEGGHFNTSNGKNWVSNDAAT